MLLNLRRRGVTWIFEPIFQFMEAFLDEAAIQRASATLAQCHLRPKLATVYAWNKI